MTIPPPQAPPSPAGADPAPRPASAFIAILSTLLLGGSVLGILFYGSITQPEPSRVIVVRANSDWVGVQLELKGDSLSEPKITRVEELGQYVVPFFVWPGKYTLHVTSDGREVFTRTFDVTVERLAEVDLIKEGATTHPSTEPSTQPAASRTAQ